MNPMLRWASAIHDVKSTQGEERMQRKRDAQRIKLRQEKEKRRLDAIERENRRRLNQEGAAEREGGDEQKNEESAACKFQKELCWCIQQLELGLVNMKPNAQQAQEAERLLKILKSSKAPMARKRQIMRASFGNYRARMQQEEKKHAEAMKRSKSLTPVESEKLNTATFYRRATSSAPGSSNQSSHSKFVSVEPVILEADNEGLAEFGTGQRPDASKESPDEDDVLMRSLELETMDMHLCKSVEDSAKIAGAGTQMEQDDSNRDDNKQREDEVGGMSVGSTQTSKEADEMESEKENIPSRTSTEDDDTNQSQISSNFSSSGSLFSFNFEIKEADMDVLDTGRTCTSMPTSHQKVEALETQLLRGKDNRASDSTSSSGGTPPNKKGGGRRRNRGKKKQQQQQPDNQDESRPSAKEALLTESPKIEMAAKEGFIFNFPEPLETSGI
ncbi:uncharacterized protein [Diadema setosum]|uniref:uncharacterized protein n=1 Tax=Diadema setosum TaxID=31175 RepID=UPI003B3B3E9C